MAESNLSTCRKFCKTYVCTKVVLPEGGKYLLKISSYNQNKTKECEAVER